MVVFAISRHVSDAWRLFVLRFFEIAFVLVHFDHVARIIVNVNHGSV
jgi:hypothetical protein